MRPEDEIVWVADAADPGPEAPIGDVQMDPEEPEPIDPEAAIRDERQRALLAARRHLERSERRAVDWGRVGLAEVLFCAIDLETTGCALASGDEILEVGAVRFDARDLGAELGSLVNPFRRIGRAAQAVHGITDADVMSAPALTEVLPSLLEMTRGTVLVFHNAGFDLGFLQRALLETGREPLALPVVDTLLVARQLVGGSCGLGTLGGRLGIDLPHPHRALADARLTARVLQEFVGILVAAGATSLADIPGVRARPPRPRRRPGPAGDPLVARLESARLGREALRLAYRLGPGLVPLEMHVRPERVTGRACLVLDLDRGTPVVLDLARVVAVVSDVPVALEPPDAGAPCQAPPASC